jgi:hypothetical protein
MGKKGAALSEKPLRALSTAATAPVNSIVMLKWVGMVFLVLFLGLCTVAYLYTNTLRRVGILDGKADLKMAAKDYAKFGYLTNYGPGSYQVWHSTNLVTIDGTQYQCFIATTNRRFQGEGSLAMTTNQVFIWLDNKRSPKIIGRNYQAPLFPPRF